MPSVYLPRAVDSEIAAMLEDGGALLLEGARACGKSATGWHHAASGVQLDRDLQARRLAEIDPGRVLVGATPRFIDEWQLIPEVWNQVRAAVDEDPSASYILAGSATPADDITRHSGAGRILRVRMRPMALAESGHSNAEVSLRSLFEDERPPLGAESTLTVDALATCAVRGGWPGLRERSDQRVSAQLASYLSDVARTDIAQLEGEPTRSPDGVHRLMRSLGRVTGTEASHAALSRDSSSGGVPMAAETVSRYLAALERVFVIEDQPSWGPHLRSRDRVRHAPKRHFTDPSLAVAAVGADADRLLDDLEYFGQVFESLVVRDLRTYSQPFAGRVLHYRDSAGREVDAIVERADGSWIACEVKLAASREEEAAASLHRFVDAVDARRTPTPKALVVITGGRYAYTRPDGVHVVPIGVLGP